MIRLNRVMLPTDFSQQAAVATPYACELADKFDAELHLFHVLAQVASTTPAFGGGLALPANAKEPREHAEAALATQLDGDWRASHRVVEKIADGHAFVEIVRYAREQEIDLIIMGTHGRSGLVHALMGSVAERVVRKAPCPVLTVKPEGHQFVPV